MRKGGVAIALATMLVSGAAFGQLPRRPPPTPSLQPPQRTSPPAPQPSAPARTEAVSDLRAHFGIDLAQRLERSNDPDERLRALARAAAIGTPQAIAFLVNALETTSTTRNDARAKIEIARGLAAHTDVPAARAALQTIVSMGSTPAPRATAAFGTGDPFGDEAEQAGRLELARKTAAIALARADDVKLTETLVANVRMGAGGPAAVNALIGFPPSTLPLGTAVMTPSLLRMLGTLGDLRALDAVRAATHANDVPTRAAAITAMGQLGDGRGIELAQTALLESDPRMRAAAADALVALDAPSRSAAVLALLTDDATAAAGIRLAEVVHDDAIVRALATRTVNASDPATRAAAVAAIGRAPGDEAVRALSALTNDELLRGDAANALAHSPSDAAMAAIVTMTESPQTRRLGVRAYVARVIARGEKSGRARDVIAGLARSSDAADRALGTFARIVLGDASVAESLVDRDPSVRRAVAAASLARDDAGGRRALLADLALESDPASQVALAAGLVGGDPEGRIPTLVLLEWAESGAPDAPLAAMAFARRASDADSEKVDALLSSRDAVLRAHVARGLAASTATDATGRLAAAYRYEADATVRRAIVLALGSRAASAPSRVDVLTLAAHLDPEAGIRALAKRALDGGSLDAFDPSGYADHDGARSEGRDVAWLRLVSADGGATRVGRFTAAIVRADGLAVPFAFDADGYALIPGMPAGPARLVLAPKLPEAYTKPAP